MADTKRIVTDEQVAAMTDHLNIYGELSADDCDAVLDTREVLLGALELLLADHDAVNEAAGGRSNDCRPAKAARDLVAQARGRS